MTDSNKTLMDAALRVGEKLGVPVLVLGVLLWFARDACIALMDNFLTPVVKSHVEFLETTQETLKEIGTTQHQQATVLQEIAIGQRQLQQAISRDPATRGTN